MRVDPHASPHSAGVRSRRKPLDTPAVPAACCRTSPSTDEPDPRANWEDGDTASAPAETTNASARFTVFAFNQRSYPMRSPAAPNTDSTATANALSNSRRSRRSGRDTCIDDRPIPKRMSLMSRKPASIPPTLAVVANQDPRRHRRFARTRHHGSSIFASWTQTTAPTGISCASVTRAPTSRRARPPAPTHSAATRRSPRAFVT